MLTLEAYLEPMPGTALKVPDTLPYTLFQDVSKDGREELTVLSEIAFPRAGT